MGRVIDQNKPFSDTDKEYLRSRGRGYLIHANERRFGTNGEKYVEGDGIDNHAISPFYAPAERAAAVYDVGGAPLPGTVLDYDTGRVADRVNGVTVEFTGPGHTPGAHDLAPQRDIEYYEGFQGYEVDENGNPIDDHIDEDIIDFVVGLDSPEKLVEKLGTFNIEFDKDDNEEILQDRLAVGLQDLRDEGSELDLSKE